MHGSGVKDGELPVDWGRTSEDYDRFRPNYPAKFFDRLRDWGVGLTGQKILDLGTGVGFLARSFATAGCEVVGVDLSQGQVRRAQSSARRDGVSVGWAVARAEALPVAEASFDIATASQCWPYFDVSSTLNELRRVLRGPRLLVTCHFCWLPRLDPVAARCEEIILEHNPQWSGADWSGEIPTQPRWMVRDGDTETANNADLDGIESVGSFWFDTPVSFSEEAWRGRLRACRGVGATLPEHRVAEVDVALKRYLRGLDAPFDIRHRVDAHFIRVGE